MKKSLYIVIAALAAAFTFSCSKELPAPSDNDGLVTFTATTADTKTELAGGHTVWSANDRIKVFYGSEGASVTASIKTGEGTSHATYQAAVPSGVDYYAVYPASAEASLSGSTVSVTIPSEQNGVFGAGHTAVAKGVDKVFSFTNVNSFLKITLPEAGYTRITVKSPSGGALSGPVNVACGNDIVISPGSGVQDFVEIASESGFPAGDVFISVIPGVTHSGGLLLGYFKNDGYVGGYFLDKEITTEPSVIHSFGEFGVTGEYFASVEGAGNKTGINPENAMDVAALKDLLTMPEDADRLAAKADALYYATIHMAAGTYDFQDSVAIAFPGLSDRIRVDITGVTGTIITGLNTHRLLNIGANANVFFTGITFDKGLGNASGKSPIRIEDDAEVVFTRCTFQNCSNKKPDNSYATGGCIYACEDTELSFDDCEFSGNKASYASTLLVKGKATIKNSYFHHNDGTWPGSALYLDNEDAKVEVTGTRIEDNTVTANSGEKPDGGAIMVMHGSLTMTDCSILRNSIPGRRGGAMRVQNDSFAKLVNCKVGDNTADWGGAINIANDGVVEIEGGTYQGNNAKGGGCILTSNTSKLIIKDAVFKENYVKSNGNFGGAIRHESNGPLAISNTVFEGNHIDYNGENEAFGGAVSIAYDQNKAQVTIDKCNFKNNHTKSGGGTALCYQSSGDGGTGWMKVTDTVFEGNYNEYTGSNNNNYARHAGAVRLGHDSTDSFFDNCTFINNSTQTAETEIKSCYGGAVTFYSDGNGHFNNCRFEGNSATRGGAISVWNCTISGIFLNGCTFSGNWCSYKNGTTIYFEKAKYFAMNNCSIADDTYSLNESDDAACWVYLNGDTDKIMEECAVSNCSFIGSARSSSMMTALPGQELLYMGNIKSGKNYYLVNNLILAESGQYSWKIGESGTSVAYGYNNVYSAKTGDCPYTASGDTSGKAKADLGSLSWDSAAFAWKWNGTLAGGYTPITSSGFSSAIGGASSSFKSWLEEIGALGKDQLGTDRGSGNWWPGAYQN